MIRRLLLAFAALVFGWLSLPSLAPARTAPDSTVQVITYNTTVYWTAPSTPTAERGPHASHSHAVTANGAVGPGPHRASVYPDGVTSPPAFAYDHPSMLVQVARTSGAQAARAAATAISTSPTRVASQGAWRQLLADQTGTLRFGRNPLTRPGPGTGDGIETAANGGDDLIRLSTKDSWANLKTLDDHLVRHGADFGATSADDYARMGSEFFQRGGAQHLPTKIAPDGTIRMYDPASNTFGSFAPNGMTKTLFKPTSPDYWSRQPGVLQ